ncbi:MAG TPA: ABC transporter permease [Alphaproteobacteria bacterium]|nr:ABC transporter permease [Alphaproteobacteria bacterium]
MKSQESWSADSVATVALEERQGDWRADGTVVGREQKPSGAWRVTFRRLRRSHTAMFGMGIAALVFLVAIFADVIAPYGYADMHPENMLQGPSWQYWFGTDQMGRDVLSRVIYGSRISIYVGVVSTIFGALMGIPLGIIAAYYGGVIDNFIMRLIDIWVAFPNFLLALVISVILGPSVTNVVIALAIVRVPTQARVMRGTALSIKENEYVQAARAVGVQDFRLLLRYILPNCMAPIIVLGTLEVATAIIVEAALSFLGLGTQPPTPSWGWDLRANVVFIEDNPWIAIFPGLAIFITVLGFNLFGDGLRDALDPRLKQ